MGRHFGVVAEWYHQVNIYMCVVYSRAMQFVDICMYLRNYLNISFLKLEFREKWVNALGAYDLGPDSI